MSKTPLLEFLTTQQCDYLDLLHPVYKYTAEKQVESFDTGELRCGLKMRKLRL